MTIEELEAKKAELQNSLLNLKNDYVATEGALQFVDHLIKEEREKENEL